MDVKPDYLRKFRVTENEPDDDYCLIHRKYCGYLTFAQLYEIANDSPSTCETMGSLSVEHGLMDAISWNIPLYHNYDELANLNLYISPVPEDNYFEDLNNLPVDEVQIKNEKVIAQINPLFDFLSSPDDYMYNGDKYEDDMEDKTIYFHVPMDQSEIIYQLGE